MDDFNAPIPVGELTQQGINQGDIQKLIDGGYHTVEAVIYTPKKALILVKGLSEGKIDKILEAC